MNKSKTGVHSNIAGKKTKTGSGKLQHDTKGWIPQNKTGNEKKEWYALSFYRSWKISLFTVLEMGKLITIKACLIYSIYFFFLLPLSSHNVLILSCLITCLCGEVSVCGWRPPVPDYLTTPPVEFHPRKYLMKIWLRPQFMTDNTSLFNWEETETWFQKEAKFINFKWNNE